MLEREIQRAIFAHIRTRGAPGIVAFHPRNSGEDQRGRRRGINAGLGVLSGASDVILLHCKVFYALELKRLGQKVTDGDVQDQFIKAVISAGGIAGWASGLDQAIRWLELHGLLIGRAS